MNRNANWGVPSHSYPDLSQVSRIVGGIIPAAAVAIAIAIPGASNQGRVVQAVKQIPKPQVELTSRVYVQRPAVGGVQNIDITPATETDAAQALSFTDGPSISQGITPATETDVAQALSVTDGPSISQGITEATETDVAQPLSYTVETGIPRVVKAIRAESYPDLQRPSRFYAYATPGDFYSITPATETDAAQSLSFTDGPAITMELGRNEKKTITVSDTPGPPTNSGNFTLTFKGQTTVGIDCTAQNAATTQAALEGLSNIDPGDVQVTNVTLSGSEQTKQLIEFTGNYAKINIPDSDFSINNGTMTDATRSVGNTQQGELANEVDEAQPLSYFVDSVPVPVPPVIRATKAHNYPDRSEVSQPYTALQPTTLPTPAMVAVQGHTNQGQVVHQVQAFQRQEPKDPVPVVFVFVNSAPPIFNVILQGKTNQGYKFQASEAHSPLQFELGSRVFEAVAGIQAFTLTPATETDTAMGLSYVVEGGEVSRQRMLTGMGT